MKVFIPAPIEYFNAAEHTLNYEGIKTTSVFLIDETDYGNMIRDAWHEGEGFILVEHDIAPWPGAIKQLINCPEDWCGYEYIQGSHQLGWAIGCVKFSSKLVKQLPNFPDRWVDAPWYGMDAAIINGLWDELHKSLHIHHPPVAHVRQRLN